MEKMKASLNKTSFDVTAIPSINLSAAVDVLPTCIHLSSKVENCWQENIKKKPPDEIKREDL